MHKQRTLNCREEEIVKEEEPSRVLSPCKIVGRVEAILGKMPAYDEWECDLYYGSLRRFKTGAFWSGGQYAVIGITAKDETARHDWREFQQIKNSLLGPEWEGVELYPAESRLVDPTNRFYLWCFPPGVLAGLGLPHREGFVQGPLDGGPAQRAFGEEKQQ